MGRRLTIIPIIDGSLCAPVAAKVSAASDSDVIVECPFALGDNDAFVLLRAHPPHLAFRVVGTRERDGHHEILGTFDRGMGSDHRPVHVTAQFVAEVLATFRSRRRRVKH